MGISAVDELLVQQIFEKKPKPRLPWVPFWVHEIVLLIVSWLGLFHLDDPKMLVITLEKIAFYVGNHQYNISSCKVPFCHFLS